MTDGNAKALIRVSLTTTEQELFGSAGTFAAPFGLATTELGDLIVADEGGTVFQIDAKTSVRTSLLSEGLRGPSESLSSVRSTGDVRLRLDRPGPTRSAAV